MTKDQARIYFLNSLDEDLEEVWEQEFFDHKQFFLTRPPIHKVWQARLNRLEKKYTAYLVLTNQENEIENPENVSTLNVDFSDEFITAFHELHDHRIQYKTQVFQAQTFTALAKAIHQWLAIEKQYFLHWEYPPSLKNEIKAIRSTETDPMVLLEELKEVEKMLGSSKLEKLKANFNNLPKNVRKEVKRLTLLAKDLI